MHLFWFWDSIVQFRCSLRHRHQAKLFSRLFFNPQVDQKQTSQICVVASVALWLDCVWSFSVEQVEQAEAAAGLASYVACRDFEILCVYFYASVHSKSYL